MPSSSAPYPVKLSACEFLSTFGVVVGGAVFNGLSTGLTLDLLPAACAALDGGTAGCASGVAAFDGLGAVTSEPVAVDCVATTGGACDSTCAVCDVACALRHAM